MKTTDFLSDLGKWQARSHPELATRQPEELFEAGFVERYHRLHNDLWECIIRLHGTLTTLEQLRGIPFDYLYGLNGMEFWQLVDLNFVDTSILMLHRLVNDTGADASTLCSFRNEIIKGPWLSQEKCDLLKQTLGERKFDGVVNSIAKRVDLIRDSCVAHRLVDKQSGTPKEALARVSLEELRRLFNAAHSLFGALSFGSSYVTLAGDLMPSMVGGKASRTCLDEVLDAVLRDNDFVNQPERRAQWWPEERKFMQSERLRVMNDLRRRIGLPEA